MASWSHTATLRCYAELNDFLPAARRQRRFTVRFDGHPAVKDTVEAAGVPHPEIDVILVNGRSVGFEHPLDDGDDVAVYPVFETLDVGDVQRLRPAPLRATRFVCDVHLGKLARGLRLMGFDTAWDRDADDPALVDRSLAERRILLTRDLGLLKVGRLTHGLWVRATDPDEQLLEIVQRLDLGSSCRPFTRCTACNGAVSPAPREAVADRVPPRSLAAFDAFWACAGCGRVYWRGTHYDGLLRRVEAVTGRRPPP